MAFMTRVSDWLGLSVRSEPAEPPAAVPAPAERVLYVAPTMAERIGTVFTCVSIITTALEQLTIDRQRNDMPVTASAFVRQPDPDMSRSRWLQLIGSALALHGNAYLRIYRHADSTPAVARFLDPAAVAPWLDRYGVTRYHVDGRDLDGTEVRHLMFMPPTGRGQLLGLGPIQAAQTELTGHLDVSAAGSGWFWSAGTPAGLLTTDQALSSDQRRDLLASWNDVPAGRTRLMSNGVNYTPFRINPKDAQFLESRRFSKTEIVDLFGVPQSLFNGLDTGNASTYANISQDWLGFVRFRMMRYVREIEEALTGLLPRGQEARFNLESLLRPDTQTRMTVHEIAIRAGIYSADYARSIEHIPGDAAPAAAPAALEGTA